MGRVKSPAAEKLREDTSHLTAVAEPLTAEQALTKANAALGLTGSVCIVAVTQRNADSGAEYDLDLASGALVTIDSAATLLHPQRFEVAFLPPSGHVIDGERDRPTQKRIAQLLITAATIDYTAGDENEETHEWLAAFTADHPPVLVDLDDMGERFDVFSGGDSRPRAKRFGEPLACFYSTDRRLYIVRPALHKHVRVVQGQHRVSSRELGKRLARLGFERPRNQEGKITATSGSERITLSFWYSTPGFGEDG